MGSTACVSGIRIECPGMLAWYGVDPTSGGLDFSAPSDTYTHTLSTSKGHGVMIITRPEIIQNTTL